MFQWVCWGGGSYNGQSDPCRWTPRRTVLSLELPPPNTFHATRIHISTGRPPGPCPTPKDHVWHYFLPHYPCDSMAFMMVVVGGELRVATENAAHFIQVLKPYSLGGAK